MEDFPVRLPIKLGQLVKLVNFAESGAHARDLIEAGEVSVNGEVETRRAHKLEAGDVVSVGGYSIRVVAQTR
ncbi:ribosome-associated protein [Trueperella bonasi]|uniref:Ribosome-associated protein n=1 Tax=Trueperella bonasi TaxID=312286 RepID=A0ABT9NJ19_9ACTO|nr:RNA-binding S4 domain-containing protein [Trueperella bonasi]MDP9807028.1 ribosome-associated protein [Trueperella bonasi]